MPNIVVTALAYRLALDNKQQLLMAHPNGVN